MPQNALPLIQHLRSSFPEKYANVPDSEVLASAKTDFSDSASFTDYELPGFDVPGKNIPVWGSALTGLISGVGTTLSGIGTNLSRLESQGAGRPEDIEKYRSQSLFAQLGDTLSSVRQPEPYNNSVAKFLAQDVPAGITSMIPALGAMAAAGPAAIPVGMAMWGLQGSEDNYQRAMREGKGWKRAMEEADIGGLVGMSNVIPVLNAEKFVAKAMGGTLRPSLQKAFDYLKTITGKAAPALARGGAEATEEIVQETGSAIANDYLTGRPVDWSGAAYAGGVGGGSGFVIGALLHALGIKYRNDPKAMADAVEDISNQSSKALIPYSPADPGKDWVKGRKVWEGQPPPTPGRIGASSGTDIIVADEILQGIIDPDPSLGTGMNVVKYNPRPSLPQIGGNAQRLLPGVNGNLLNPSPRININKIIKDIRDRGIVNGLDGWTGQSSIEDTKLIEEILNNVAAPQGLQKIAPIPVSREDLIQATPAQQGATGDVQQKPKEPWEMTRAEWIDLNLKEWEKNPPTFNKKYQESILANAFDHGPAVAAALDIGKPIPPHVLAEYPDLSDPTIAPPVIPGQAALPGRGVIPVAPTLTTQTIPDIKEPLTDGVRTAPQQVALEHQGREEGINISLNFPLGKIASNILKTISVNPIISKLSKISGITNISVDSPHTFSLSQQGAITKDGTLRLNPNSVDIGETYLHELGHVLWSRSSDIEKENIIAMVKSNPRMFANAPGYLMDIARGEYDEAVSHLYGNILSLPKVEQDVLINVATGKSFLEVYGNNVKKPLPGKQVLSSKKIVNWEEKGNGYGLYIKKEHDLKGMVDKYGDRVLSVEDVNGGHHYIPASEVYELLKDQKFSGNISSILYWKKDLVPSIDSYTVEGIPGLKHVFEDKYRVKISGRNKRISIDTMVKADGSLTALQQGEITPPPSVNPPVDTPVAPDKISEGKDRYIKVGKKMDDTKNPTTVKGQKIYLLDKIDEAIEVASDDTKPVYGIDEKGRTVVIDPGKIINDKITIKVPNDGTFTVINSKFRLNEFKQRVKKEFPEIPNIKSKSPTPNKSGSTGRVSGTEVEYYNEFKTRKQGLVKGEHNFHNKGYFTNGQYLVKAPKDPKITLNDQLAPPSFDRIIKARAANLVPTEIIGEFNTKLDASKAEGKKGDTVVAVHTSTGEAFTAHYVDSILTQHPTAKSFVSDDGSLVFKVDNEVVGIVAEYKNLKEQLIPYQDRIAELRGTSGTAFKISDKSISTLGQTLNQRNLDAALRSHEKTFPGIGEARVIPLDSVPPEVLSRFEKIHPGMDITRMLGFYDKSGRYVIVQEHNTLESAVEVARHEWMHGLLTKTSPEIWHPVLKNGLSGETYGKAYDAYVRSATDGIVDDDSREAARKAYYTDPEKRAEAVKEVIADAWRERYNKPTLWNRIVARITSWLRNKGFLKGGLTDVEVKVLVNKAMDMWAQQGFAYKSMAPAFAIKGKLNYESMMKLFPWYKNASESLIKSRKFYPWDGMPKGDGKWDIFKTKWGETFVIKNPTDQDYQNLTKEYKDKMRAAGLPVQDLGIEFLRETYDIYGNKYLWIGNFHNNVEPEINKKYNTTTGATPFNLWRYFDESGSRREEVLDREGYNYSYKPSDMGEKLAFAIKGEGKSREWSMIDPQSLKDLNPETEINNWLLNGGAEPAEPKVAFRGVPKGSGTPKKMGNWFHATIWPMVARRGGKFGDSRMVDVYSIPIPEGTLHYRGGALAETPFEYTHINSIHGMKWNELLQETKKLYEKYIRQGQMSRSAAYQACQDLIKASFELDAEGNTGRWHGKTVPKSWGAYRSPIIHNEWAKKVEAGDPSEKVFTTPVAQFKIKNGEINVNKGNFKENVLHEKAKKDGELLIDPSKEHELQPKEKLDRALAGYIRVYGEGSEMAKWATKVLTAAYSLPGNAALFDVLSDEKSDLLASGIKVFDLLARKSPGDALAGIQIKALEALQNNLVTRVAELQASGKPEDILNAQLLSEIAEFNLALTQGAVSEAGRVMRDRRFRHDLLIKLLGPSIDILEAGKIYQKLKEDIRRNGGMDMEEFFNTLDTIKPEMREPFIKKILGQKQKYDDAKKWLRAYLYTNMLFNTKTNARNLFSTLFQVALQNASMPLAVLAGKMTGSKNVSLGELSPSLSLYSTVSGIVMGAQQSWELLRFGKLQQELDMNKDFEHTELPGVLGWLPNFSQRLMNASDIFCRAILWQQEFHRIAMAIANNSGLSKIPGENGELSPHDALFTHLMEHPTPEIIKELNEMSKLGVFREEGGDISKAIGRLRSAVDKHTFIGGTIIMPFLQTTANVTKRMMEMTPAGLLFKDQATWRRKWMTGQTTTRAEQQAIARTALGCIGLTTLAIMVAAGMIEVAGNPPDDKEERDKFFLTKQPNSFRIPLLSDKWFEYMYFGAFGPAMSLIASAEANVKFADPTTYPTVIMDTAKSVMSSSFLSGVSSLMGAINSPDQVGPQFWSSLASMFTPLSSAQREVVSRTQPIRDTKGWYQKWQANTPMVWPVSDVNEIPPRIDMAGNILDREDVQDFGFVKIKEVKLSDASNEIIRLNDEGYGVPVAPPKTRMQVPKLLVSKLGREFLTQQEEFNLNRTKGQLRNRLVARIMSRPEYQRWDDERKAETIMDAFGRLDRSMNKMAKRVLAQTGSLLSIQPPPGYGHINP